MNLGTPDDDSLERLLGQIAGEFTQRLNSGESPSVQEYVDKHQGNPKLAEALREVLPALRLISRPDVKDGLAEADPLLGTVLGGEFRVIREIGRGGMGIVYEALQLSLNKMVALKILPAAASLDPKSLKWFKNEAMAAARLDHEHIVPVYSVGSDKGLHYYVMKLINGHSLAVYIQELRRRAGLQQGDPDRTSPFFPSSDPSGSAAKDTAPLANLTTEGPRSSEYFEAVAEIGYRAAEALAYAHQMSVRHRDIKPGNLLLDSRNSVWITDFGLAQMQNNAELIVTGQLHGTLRYMSPEQTLANRVPVDDRTDIYSLGATLYELLTLHPPFNGRDERELLRQIAFDDPLPPRRLNRNIPRDLETIVLGALVKSPDHRYPTARAMADDLHNFVRGEPIFWRPESWPRWLCRKARRHATPIMLALSAVVTVVVLALFVLHLNQPSAEDVENARQQAALKAHEDDLKQQEKVILIGAQGRPGYFRWKTDENPAKIADLPDGTFSVQNWEHGLIELLPDPQLERYRFSAEVRHEKQSNHESRVGIYFLRSEHPVAETVAHCYCNVAFNDLVNVALPDKNGIQAGNAAGLEAHRQSSAGLVQHVFCLPNAATHFDPARPVGAVGPWRKIAVEVQPKTIKAFWAGKSIATVPRDSLKFCAKWLTSRPNEPALATAPPFRSSGGLGLFVSQGIASFRNVTVEPLGEDN